LTFLFESWKTSEREALLVVVEKVADKWKKKKSGGNVVGSEASEGGQNGLFGASAGKSSERKNILPSQSLESRDSCGLTTCDIARLLLDCPRLTLRAN
jgi:hypothetical protein